MSSRNLVLSFENRYTRKPFFYLFSRTILYDSFVLAPATPPMDEFHCCLPPQQQLNLWIWYLLGFGISHRAPSFKNHHTLSAVALGFAITLFHYQIFFAFRHSKALTEKMCYKWHLFAPLTPSGLPRPSVSVRASRELMMSDVISMNDELMPLAQSTPPLIGP